MLVALGAVFLQFFRLINDVSFVVITDVNPFHVNLPVVNLIRQSLSEEVLDLNIPNGAAFHSQKVILFVHQAPVYHLAQLLFQDQVQPNPGAAAVTLPEGVGYVHLHILLHDLLKRGLRHFLDVGQGGLQIHDGGEPEVSLGQVHGADTAGEVVEIGEQEAVDLQKGLDRAGFQPVQDAGFKELGGPLFAQALLRAGQLGGIGDVVP